MKESCGFTPVSIVLRLLLSMLVTLEVGCVLKGGDDPGLEGAITRDEGIQRIEFTVELAAAPDGSRGPAPAPAASPGGLPAGESLAGTTIDFNDLSPSEAVTRDRYLSSGVQVDIGPSSTVGGFVLGSGGGPCDASPSIETEPFVGPSFLFRFPNGASSVSLKSGDFGPSDEDVITLKAYGDDALTQVVTSQTQTLAAGVPTGCVSLTVTAPVIRAVEVVSTGIFPNSVFVDDLSFTPLAQGPFFGADTSVHPNLSQFPTATGFYDYYMGQVGFGDQLCAIGNLGANSGQPACSAFELPAAQLAKNTFAYWNLQGPLIKAFKKLNPFAAGQEQAKLLVQQWQTYHAIQTSHDPKTVPAGSPTMGPVITGLTLFADIEPPPNKPLSDAGWAVCDGLPEGSDCALKGNYAANATLHGFNRQLLEGFFAGIAQAGLGFTPGVYTNADSWIQAFGEDYRSPQPFVLWAASCHANVRTDVQAKSDFPAIANTTFGGEQTVIWQYQTGPDFDISSRDPAVGFSAQANAQLTYRCTCGSCPLTNREFGLYLTAAPNRVPIAGGTVTLTNPTVEPIGNNVTSFIEILPKSNSGYSLSNNTCGNQIPPGASCTITVTPTSKTGNAPKVGASLFIQPPKAATLIVPISDCSTGVGVIGC